MKHGLFDVLRTAALAGALLVSGCATWFFEPQRSARFVNEDNVYIHVDYAVDRKVHVSRFITPTGIEMEFKSGEKVRVTAPDGSRFVAWRNMSESGSLFVSEDGTWKYFEMAGGCVLAKLAPERDGYLKVFEGVVCAQLRPPLDSRGKRIR